MITFKLYKKHIKRDLTVLDSPNFVYIKFINYDFKLDIFLNRCGNSEDKPSVPSWPVPRVESTTLYPPQWVQCDLRYLDTTVLGEQNKLIYILNSNELILFFYYKSKKF